MGRQIHTITLKREQGQKWGFGLTGGKDYALTFRVEKVALCSPAGKAIANIEHGVVNHHMNITWRRDTLQVLNMAL